MNDPIQLDEFRQRVGKKANDRILKAAPAKGNKLRSDILELNQSVRNAKQQMGHLDCGSLMMQIPELDYYVLLRRFPELNSQDPTENKNAWEKFMRAPESEPYKVRRNDGKIGRR